MATAAPTSLRERALRAARTSQCLTAPVSPCSTVSSPTIRRLPAACSLAELGLLNERSRIMGILARTHFRRALALGCLLVAAIVVALTAPAADHRDGPIFPNTAVNGFQDINDMFIFQAPGNINNTVVIMNVQPFPGNLSPATFDPRMTFDLKIDNNGDAVEDITFRVTFGAPGGNGIQPVTVRALPSSRFPPTGIVARGMTGQNIPIAGGGMFRAAIHDDPFFFDAGQFNAFIAAGMGLPVRPPPAAHNFFGPNVNTLAMILELPTARIRSSPSLPNVGLWGVSIFNGVQVDRMGRPAINTALIPP